MSDSPAKKLNFNSTEDKENVFKPIVGIPDLPEVDEVVKPTVAPTIKEEEQDEPLLQENPQRFVLFPIKYHDVSRRVQHLVATQRVRCPSIRRQSANA
jgi:ribonucleoside-diphosphate reductase subunit M2